MERALEWYDWKVWSCYFWSWRTISWHANTSDTFFSQAMEEWTKKNLSDLCSATGNDDIMFNYYITISMRLHAFVIWILPPWNKMHFVPCFVELHTWRVVLIQWIAFDDQPWKHEVSTNCSVALCKSQTQMCGNMTDIHKFDSMYAFAKDQFIILQNYTLQGGPYSANAEYYSSDYLPA